MCWTISCSDVHLLISSCNQDDVLLTSFGIDFVQLIVIVELRAFLLADVSSIFLVRDDCFRLCSP